MSATGTPYDSLLETIGVIDSNSADSGSLRDFGVGYRQVGRHLPVSRIRMPSDRRLMKKPLGCLDPEVPGLLVAAILLASDIAAIVQTVDLPVAGRSSLLTTVREFVGDPGTLYGRADLCAGSFD